MKKHEACYWLNKIIGSKKEDLERYEKPVSDKIRDYKTNEERDITDEERDNEQRWRDRGVAECRAMVEALDIAAASLTK